MEDLDRREQRPQEKDTIPVTTSVRISPATKKQLNDLVNQLHFDNQDQLLNYLFRVEDTNQIKAGLPGRETEIESFETYMNEMFEIYKGSLRTCQDAELRIREKFEGTLRSNDETIQDLQAKLRAAVEEAEKLNAAYSKLSEQVIAQRNEIEQSVRERDAANRRCTEYKEKNDTLINTVREFEEDHKKVGKLNEELMLAQNRIKNSEVLARESEKEIKYLTEENGKNGLVIEDLKSQVKDLEDDKKSLSDELAKLREEYSRKIFEKDQERTGALLEAREKYAEQLEEERKKSREEYTALIAQIKDIRPVRYVETESST